MKERFIDGESDTYTCGFCTAKDAGKTDAYARTYASAYARTYAEAKSAGRSDDYAFAIARVLGKTDVEAGAFIH